MGCDSVAKSSPQGPRWDLSGVPKELKKPIIDHLVCHRNHLLKESARKKLRWRLSNEFTPRTTHFRDRKALVKTVIEEGKQKEIFTREMKKTLEYLGKDITSVQTKLDESLTTSRSAIASHYDGFQSMLNTSVNDPNHVLMDDDDDSDISGDNETSRERCLLCIARAKHKTLRESNDAYSNWVAHQEHKKVAETTRVNNDQLREQISKGVDSTNEPSKANTCSKCEELFRVHEQVSLLTKAVSKLIVDSSKSKNKATNKPTKNGPRRRGRCISAARKNPCSQTQNKGTRNHDRARSGSLPKITPQAKAEGKRKRRTSGKNGPSRKKGRSASANGSDSKDRMSALKRPRAFVDMSQILRFPHSKETLISCPHLLFSLMC